MAENNKTIDIKSVYEQETGNKAPDYQDTYILWLENRVEALTDELGVVDKILENRNKVLAAIPECNMHSIGIIFILSVFYSSVANSKNG